MNIDLTIKYRPQTFADFWHKSGTVDNVITYFTKHMLPKSMIFSGDYGTGKTSLARVIGKAASCKHIKSYEPCGQCYGCLHWDTLFMSCTGAAAIIRGNDFDAQHFNKIVYEVSTFPPPEPYNAHIIIIDEAHRIPAKEQEMMLDRIEDSRRSHFIFCTTHLDKINNGIKARSHSFALPLPTVKEAIDSMQKIAKQEKIIASQTILHAIAIKNNCIPRNCLKDLQAYKVFGENIIVESNNCNAIY